jgi:large conductance mechanosensitive channel
MGLLTEFKEFAVRGNVVDLAVGVVIGAAFGKIVSSLVSDVILPPLGWLIGNVDFSALEWVLQPAATAADGTAIAAVSLKYGLFLNAVVQFTIVAFAIFIVVKAINRLRPPAPAAPAGPSDEVKLLTEIRDALKSR